MPIARQLNPAVKAENTASVQVGRDVIWSHDCNIDSATWTFGNGSDIAGSPWEGIDLNFECSTDGLESL